MQVITEPVDGLLLIRLPLPFELNHVNVALVRLDDGWMLIDCGLGVRESSEALERALESRGIAWAHIRWILATHMHPDHIGSAPRLIEKTGARFAMHRAELEHLNRVIAAGRPPWLTHGLTVAGTPRDYWEEIEGALVNLRRSLGALQPDRLFEGGESIPTAIGEARVVWTPGHSPGHVCLYWPSLRLLYAGDHMLETITPNIAWMPDRDMLAEYLASLDIVKPLEIDTVIPSHGKPFSGHREWIVATNKHHDERCAQILAGLEGGARTAHELVPSVWEREFSPFHYHFAVFEVLAHLEHMRRKGQIALSETSDGAFNWTICQTAAL